MIDYGYETREDKLPLWAQEKLKFLRNMNASQRRAMDDVLKDSPVKGSYAAMISPSGPAGILYPGAGLGSIHFKLDGTFEDDISRSESIRVSRWEEGCLRIMGGDGSPLLIEPVVSNVVKVSIKKDWLL